MRDLFRSCCCCCSNSDCCNSNADVSSEISWTPGQINKAYAEDSLQQQREVPRIVITQPVPGPETVILDDFIDIDFRKDTYEDARFTDISATIFQRNYT